MSDIHALSGAYVVDALDDHERALFERHLAECGDCTLEVASLREAAATLADVPATAPPASLRASVLSGISTVRPLPPQVAESSPRRGWAPLLLAAAVAVVFGTGVVVAQPWEDSPNGVTLADRVIAAADATKSTVKIDGATATVYRSASLGRAALVTDDLPDAPDGKVYELWLQKRGVMVPAGLLEDGGDQEFLLVGDAADASAVGMTLEPDGGSSEPTLPTVAVFPLETT